MPHASVSTESYYQGEWMSELLPAAGEENLCIRLHISVPKVFGVRAKLFSGAPQPMTVYEAESAVGTHNAVELFAVLEVTLSVDGVDRDRVQLVVYVSLNVAIRTASVSTGQCPNNSTYMCLSFRLIESLKSFTSLCQFLHMFDIASYKVAIVPEQLILMSLESTLSVLHSSVFTLMRYVL